MSPFEIHTIVFHNLDCIVQNRPGHPWGVSIDELAQDIVSMYGGKIFTIDEDGTPTDAVAGAHEFVSSITRWFDRYPTVEAWIIQKEMGL